MEEILWEIPEGEVERALQWALQLVRGRKKLQGFYLHRRGVRKLDRLGRGSSTDYISILEEEVMRYVRFDIEDDIRLVFARLILRQGGKGVPIGGFLSAHLGEIWCSWREAIWGFGQSKHSV